MTLAIMQPYFLPYLGYFQLMNTCDEFIVYDNIKFSRKGWINRNRILVNGKDEYITLPLRKDSDFLNVEKRFLAETWPEERKKILNRINTYYRKAPNFENAFSLIESILLYGDLNLFGFIYNSLVAVSKYLEIHTPLTISSTIDIDHSLKAEKKVIALCKARNAARYINPIGGTELYDRQIFTEAGIELQFLSMNEISYKQFDNDYISSLSILDVLMFNPKETVREMLTLYSLK